MPEAVAKTNGTKKMRQALPAPTGIGAFFSEWYLVPVAAFSLMPLPLVIQYRLKARKLSICPSQRIYENYPALLGGTERFVFGQSIRHRSPNVGSQTNFFGGVRLA